MEAYKNYRLQPFADRVEYLVTSHALFKKRLSVDKNFKTIKQAFWVFIYSKNLDICGF